MARLGTESGHLSGRPLHLAAHDPQWPQRVHCTVFVMRAFTDADAGRFEVTGTDQCVCCSVLIA